MESIDDSTLQRLRDLGGQVLVQRLVRVFEENVPARFASAREGLAAGDMKAVEHAVHSMKSSAGNVGAFELMDLAGEAEDAAEKGQADRLPSLLAAIETSLTAVRARLAQELDTKEEEP